MPGAADPPRNLTAGAWLLADMALNIWALSIVKALGLGLPAVQLVFLRAIVGLVLMLPFVWRQRKAFVGVADLRLHALRVGFSAIALTCSFFAIARLPLALFTATGFTRPILTMIASALILREVISRGRWLAAFVGLAGVIVAVDPGTVTGGGWGLAAQAATVCAATGTVIVTRMLAQAPTVVMMTFYTAGLSLLAAPFAIAAWSPVAAGQWPVLLAIGVFAQSAQYCFLQAHRNGQASFIAILSYASLIFSTTVGFVVFAEVPPPRFWVGAALIVGAAVWVTRSRAGRAAPVGPGPKRV